MTRGGMPFCWEECGGNPEIDNAPIKKPDRKGRAFSSGNDCGKTALLPLSSGIYLMPSFLAISLGRAFLLTMIDVVLYSTNGREKYQ